MMRIVLLMAAFSVVLAIAAMAQRTRAMTLHRLALLVGDNAARPVRHGGNRRILERLLPRRTVGDLRLLGIEPVTSAIATTIVAFGLAVTAVAAVWGMAPALGLAVAIAFGTAIVLNILAKRRVAEIGAMMPGFFDRVRQLLAIGNSLPVAFARAVHGAQPRLAMFFGPALRRISNGASFAESIKQSAEDIDLYEMHLFAAAVSTNMRFGGSLTHSLNNLVSYLRRRASINRELRANTAQIRFSAWLLALLPLFVAALIVTQNRDYAAWFVSDPTGKWMLAYCGASQIAGVVAMRLIIKTEF